MAVVRPIGPLVPIILERDEGTGWRRVRAEPSVRHPVDDTREDRLVRVFCRRFDTLAERSETSWRLERR
jgi:hypothetical protein